MKLSFLAIASLLALAAGASADPGLVDLKVSPGQDLVYKSDNAEAVFDINLHGHDSVSERHAPLNLALVIDHSGSMAGAKMEKARQAGCVAIDHLQPTDTFALVQFDTQVDVLIPAQPVEDKEALKRKVESIRARGSTALYAGVQEGAQQLRKYFDSKNVNRVILLSDGIANDGPSTPADMAELGRALRDQGASVSTVGLGDDYNENVMVSLAEASGANYYYVRDAEKLPGVFEQELGQVKNAVALNLEITIEVPGGIDPIEIIGMPDVVFHGRKATVHLGSFYASQRRDLLVRCRINSPAGDSALVGRAHIVYSSPGDGRNCDADGDARVKFTAQKDDAAKSVNVTVATNAALARNSSSRARALQLQDAGKLKEAAELLKSQAAEDKSLAAQYQNSKFASEAKDLDAMGSQMAAGAPMGNAQRKTFQYENYNQSNQNAETPGGDLLKNKDSLDTLK